MNLPMIFHLFTSLSNTPTRRGEEKEKEKEKKRKKSTKRINGPSSNQHLNDECVCDEPTKIQF